MKKLIALLMTLCISSVSLFSVTASAAYDATAELDQIVTMIQKGQYLEAAQNCINTKNWHDLSDDDKLIFSMLENEARIRYDDYLNGTSSFYDTSYDISVIKYYIELGYYLEAIDECDALIDRDDIGVSDVFILYKLKNDAQMKYNDYAAWENRYSYYTYDDWGINFKWYSNTNPKLYWDNSIYDYYIYPISSYGDLYIRSYEIGDYYDFGKADNINSVISKEIKLWKELSQEGDDIPYGTKFEVLSESNTTVGGMAARQATARVYFYQNRYWTKANYILLKFIAFKYGNWIYVIQAREDKYNWSDQFWNEIEMVRISSLGLV